MSLSRLVVGAEARVYVNGQALGRVKSMEWDDSTDAAVQYGVDTLEPLELAPQSVSAVGVMHVYRIHGDGGPEGVGMGAPWANLPLQRYGSLLVLDRLTDTVLLRVDRCWFNSQRWSADRGHLVGAVGFKSLDYSAGTQAFAG